MRIVDEQGVARAVLQDEAGLREAVGALNGLVSWVDWLLGRYASDT